MPLSITVTKRELKNKGTGIDMSVPSYQQASDPKLVKDYHVVVITKLPFFKLPEHSEEDVVQFMVPRDYAAFEKFQKDVLDAFPELKLPNLPRKYHLFLKQTDIEERQLAFDCLMKVISLKKDLCTSVPVLKFLEFPLLADRNYYKARKEYLQKKEEEAKQKDRVLFEDSADGLFGEDENAGETEGQLFQEDSAASSRHAKPFAATSIFDDGDTRAKRLAKISLLADEDDDEAEIFVPSEAKVEDKDGGGLFETEDHSDLLNVSESLDDVLQKVSEVKGKPRKTATTTAAREKTSSKPASHGLGLFDSDDTVGVSEMGTDDIMKYIQQNQADADDDLDLF